MCPQDLGPEPSHSTQPSLFSTFLHRLSYRCVLQLACPQPFLFHFPPTSHSNAGLFYYLACCFLPHVFAPSCPTCSLCPASEQHTSSAHACQELSAADCAQDTTQHYPVPGCNGSRKPNEEDDSIYIICCHCPEMFLCSVVSRLSCSIA